MKILSLIFGLLVSGNALAFDVKLIPNIKKGLSETSSSMILKTSTNKKPKSTNGYLMYDRKGNYKGVVSKNQKCAFYNAYSSSNGIQVSYSQINSVQLYCN